MTADICHWRSNTTWQFLWVWSRLWIFHCLTARERESHEEEKRTLKKKKYTSQGNAQYSTAKLWERVLQDKQSKQGLSDSWERKQTFLYVYLIAWRWIASGQACLRTIMGNLLTDRLLCHVPFLLTIDLLKLIGSQKGDRGAYHERRCNAIASFKCHASTSRLIQHHTSVKSKIVNLYNNIVKGIVTCEGSCWTASTRFWRTYSAKDTSSRK